MRGGKARVEERNKRRRGEKKEKRKRDREKGRRRTGGVGTITEEKAEVLQWEALRCITQKLNYNPAPHRTAPHHTIVRYVVAIPVCL